MTDARCADDDGSRETLLAYTDTDLCYCPACAGRFGFDDPRKWGPNWLPFIAILEPDDLPEKYCDACAEPLASG